MEKQTQQQIPLTYEAMMAFIHENERILTEQLVETRQLMRENELKAEKRMKKLDELYGSWANNFGSFAEEYFFNSFEKSENF